MISIPAHDGKIQDLRYRFRANTWAGDYEKRDIRNSNGNSTVTDGPPKTRLTK